MEKLTKSQLQNLILTLEKELFALSRNAEMHNVMDSRLVSTREILKIVREELGRR